MKKWLLIGAIGALSFLMYIIYSAPASIAVNMMEEDIELNAPDIQLGQTNGTLWNGDQELQYRQFPPINIAWDLSVLPIITGRIDSKTQLTGDGVEATFDLTASGNQGAISNLTGSVGSRYLNQITIPYGLDLSDTLAIQTVDTSWENNWLTALSGNLNWPGGIVHIETPLALLSIKLPPLTGKLSMEGSDARLHITDAGNALMNIRLKKDGWAVVAINYSLLEMIGMPLQLVGPAPVDAAAVDAAAAGTDLTKESVPALIIEEKVF